MSIIDNILLNSDSYKASQFLQYPAGTSTVFSYIEGRGGEFDELCVIGMQAYLKEYLSKPITQEMIDFAEKFLTAHGEPFNKDGWLYILNNYDGYLPLRIKAVPEGTVVGISNVIATVENTDPKCFWLTSYIETALLRAIWYPTTVATKSREIKKVIAKYLAQTADDDAMGGLPFKLHDFGARGVSSLESAGLGGMAHLVNFMGTDTMIGALYAMNYYTDVDVNAPNVPGFSVPASEHSTITSWGRENEADAYENMLTQFGGKFDIVSVVSDSYDIFNATKNIWGKKLRQKVIDSGSMLVIRPDSGEPSYVVGELAQLIDEEFGSVKNSKGYRVLNNVRILQGDGLNDISDFVKILDRLVELGYSTDNVVFGMGGGLLQQVNRDTCKFAMKCSSITLDTGVEVDVYKDPIGDSGKRSKRGRLALVADGDGGHRTVQEHEAGIDTVLETVYYNGQLYGQTTLDQVRERAAI